MMRTTINLDDDLHEQVTAFAKQRKVSVGRVISDSLRQTFQSARVGEDPEGWPCFEPPSEAPRIRSKDVREAIENEDIAGT